MSTAPTPAHLPAPPQFVALEGGKDWHTVDFISDLHLQASEPGTFAAWQHYMQSTPASALFILGDLFEVWLGDDVLQLGDNTTAQAAAAQPFAFEAHCVQILQATAQHIPVFYMQGNRDFLLGADGLKRSHMQGLQDPTVLNLHPLNGQSYLLTHGDALCLDDVDYQSFRTMVRNPAWQTVFLKKPLQEREHIARQLREQSQLAQAQRASMGLGYSDVDSEAVAQWLQESGANHMVHGHTHRPFDHDVDATQTGARRYVLSDWEADAHPPRLELLRITRQGVARLPLLAS